MNTGQRTVITMLAVVAVMLGLNLIVRGSPTAVAQGPPQQEPTVVAGAVTPATRLTHGVHVWHVWRFWSDGRVDFTTADEPTVCNAVNLCGPPIVVIP